MKHDSAYYIMQCIMQYQNILAKDAMTMTTLMLMMMRIVQFLAQRCNFIANFVYCHSMSSLYLTVCLWREPRVYRDKTNEAMII